jgi:RNA polymerase sigma-70 factor (ECF subfamily)
VSVPLPDFAAGGSTSLSLLRRLQSVQDVAAWERFVDLYTPMVFRWARRAGFPQAEASDLVQDVLLQLVRSLPGAGFDPTRGRFRSWLKTVVLNRARDLWAKRRPDPVAPEVLALEPVDPPDFWDAEYDRLLLERAFAVMRAEFEEATWRACWEHLTSDRTAREIGAELGLSEAAVYTAKSRVLKRLRQELQALLD